MEKGDHDHMKVDHIGLPRTTTGVEDMGALHDNSVSRDERAKTLTPGITELSNALAVVGTSTHEVAK